MTKRQRREEMTFIDAAFSVYVAPSHDEARDALRYCYAEQRAAGLGALSANAMPASATAIKMRYERAMSAMMLTMRSAEEER